MKTFDVAVIGGGPAGAICAYELARGGARVALVSGARAQKSSIGESLPAAAGRLLRHIGLRHVLDQGGHLASVGNVSCWGSFELNYTDFIFDPNGHGWHLDREVFDRDLVSAAASVGAEMIEENVRTLQFDQSIWTLNTDREALRVGWLVDASGRAALVARSRGVARRRLDHLMAVYFWQVDDRAPADTRSWIESTGDGWWYSALVPGSKRITVFHTRRELAREIMANGERLGQVLAQTRHIKKQIRPLASYETMGCREAGSSRLDRFVGSRWIAAGDAAVGFDPLSAQGLFNALHTGMSAAKVLLQPDHLRERAAQDYGVSVEGVWSIYKQRRDHFYAQESRWPSTLFWREQVEPVCRQVL